MLDLHISSLPYKDKLHKLRQPFFTSYHVTKTDFSPCRTSSLVLISVYCTEKIDLWKLDHFHNYFIFKVVLLKNINADARGEEQM